MASTETVVTGLAINGSNMCYMRVRDLSRFTYIDVNGQVMCGTMDHISERVVPGIKIFHLEVLLPAHPGELDVLIPLIGFSESPTDTFTPTDTLTSFTALVRRKSGSGVDTVVHSYTGAKIWKAIYRTQKGNNAGTLQLNVLSTGFSEGSTFSPTAITPRQAPYWHTAGVLTLRSSVEACGAFVWHRDNFLVPRYNSSEVPDNFASIQRVSHVGVDLPYVDATDDILTTFISTGREAGITGAMLFTNGTKRLGWTWDELKWEANPPSILKKTDDVRLNAFFKAYQEGSSVLETITQDNT